MNGVRIQRVATALVEYEIAKLLQQRKTRKPRGLTALHVVNRYGLDAFGHYEYEHHKAVNKARQCVRNALMVAYRKGEVARLVTVEDFLDGKAHFVRSDDGGIIHSDPMKFYSGFLQLRCEGVLR